MQPDRAGLKSCCLSDTLGALLEVSSWFPFGAFVSSVKWSLFYRVVEGMKLDNVKCLVEVRVAFRRTCHSLASSLPLTSDLMVGA